ncbi:hypothetical protein F3Y22_tig00110944pilonHSYRG00148 [Hibiscus syriacus]|uniref:Uncharacterized protein n=1 Tax=Hibiscus syriacus TaxID=106335 RepID=A0A6A2ZBY5_HIBSY|nr:hypothetical protein F3Y22_tig00110944pilonHSYRG00148 [Hibiscus syriacus]
MRNSFAVTSLMIRAVLFVGLLVKTRTMFYVDVQQHFSLMKQSVSKPDSFPRGPSSWLPPSSPWIKINIDATRREADSHARCGGVARDCYGTWEFGFYKLLECASMKALHILKSEYNGAHSLSEHLNDLRNRKRSVQIQHVIRQRKKVDDALAKSASFESLDLVVITSPPTSIVRLLQEDMTMYDVVNV